MFYFSIVANAMRYHIDVESAHATGQLLDSDDIAWAPDERLRSSPLAIPSRRIGSDWAGCGVIASPVCA